MYQNWDKENPDLLIQDDTFLMQPEEDLSPLADRDKPVLEILGYERVMRVRILRQTMWYCCSTCWVKNLQKNKTRGLCLL